MNKYFLFSCFYLLLSANMYAQKVTYKDDIISVDERPYAIMKKSGGIVPDYSVRTLDNKEILMVRFDKGDGGSMMYIATFLGSGQQVFIKNDLGFGKKLAKEIVENDLIKNSDLNPAGERRFLMSHNASGRVAEEDLSPGRQQPGNQASKSTAINNAANDYPSQNNSSQNNYNTPPANSYNNSPTAANENRLPNTVDRDRGQKIYVAGDRIRQDNKLIGNYKKSTSAADGEIYIVFTFYLPDGYKIAEARLKQFNASAYRLTTIYDNKVRTLPINSDINIDFDQVQEIAKYLSQHYYL